MFSSIARWVKSAFYIVLWFFSLLFAYLFSFISTRKAVNIYLYRFWSRCFVNLFCFEKHVHIEKGFKFPEQYILISNHYTAIDTIWLPGSFDVRVLSKDTIRYWPIVGRVTNAGGVIFVDRRSTNSRGKSLELCRKALQQGNNLLVFPEGGISGTTLSPFHDGAFRLSAELGIPILPVYLYFEEESAFELKKEGFAYVKGLFRLKNRRIHMYIYNPVNPSAYSSSEELKQYFTDFYLRIQNEVKGAGTI